MGGVSRIDGKPHHAFATGFFLQSLHVRSVVMLAHEGAARVVPFQHDVLAFEVR